ncbi:MAG: hypothetical protein ACJ0SL_07210 [Candidatus Rariloculaceae bacterium]
MNPLAPNRRAFFSRSALALGLVLLASANAWSYRVIGQPEDAYEFLLSEVALPASVTGLISFSGCTSCVASALRVTSTTAYQLDGIAIALDELLLTVERIESEENTLVTVFFDVESLLVNRITVESYL